MKDIIAYGGGGKGGGSSRQPVEHPDNLRSIARARVLLLMSEGPIQGAATGNGNFLKSIYLNGTQAQNEDGSLNFPDIGLGYTLGTQDQDYIKGFPASENTVNVGVPLQAGRPWTQQITNSQLSAVVVNVGVNQLVRINEENMDRTGSVVNYRVQLQVGTGAFTDVVAGGFSFDGKTTSGYERSHRINLPPATRWAIRVIRDTPDSTSDTLQNSTYIGSYVEVIDAKLRYPMSALVGISIDAEHFSGGVPTVAFRGRGRIVSVPDNYDPETRTYSGVWSGGFKNAWTNNPAWIFYDLVTNDRYGLGRRITRAQIDRYTLYQIGRYCDEMVPDGFGGTEPRFTCNVYIQKASDALRVISDLASIFRGMSYWAAGLVRVSADIPSDPVHSFTNANVKGGAFVRTSSGLRQRYSVAAVSYNDMTDFGRQKVEFVQDDSAVARYGIRELQVTAFGCTSRGQAHRVGKYALVTAKVETGGIKFTVGLEQMKIQPSDVIRVHDQHRAGRRQAGRIKERASANSLIVDDAGGARVGDTIFIDDYSANINAINGNTISVSATLPTDIAQKVWAVESSSLKPELFRVISIKEISGNGIEYEIEAVEHNPSKYSAVDYGTKLESFPTTVIPSRAQEAPRNVLVSSYYVIREGVSSHTLRISFGKPNGAVRYEVQFRRNHSEWVNLPTTSSNSVEVDNVYAGAYEARVRAINSLDVPSLWAYSEITQIDGLTGEPPSLRTLTTEPIPWGIVLRWSFYSGANTIERTQIRYSTTSSFEDSQLLGDYAYPTNMYVHDNLRAGAELWYWGRVADKNGVYGPWLPLESEEGVYGVTSLNADEYNEIITKEIVGSALGQQLMEDIESIPDIQDQLAGLGVSLGQLGIDLDALGEHVTNVDDAIASLNLDIDAIEGQLSSVGIELGEIGIKFDDIEDRFYATDAEIAALQGQLSEIIGTEDWEPSSSYLEGTLVKDNGALYRATKDVPAGTPLTDTEFWAKVGDYASLGEAVTSLLARMSIVESSVNSLTGEVTTIAQQVNVLSSDLQTVDGKTNANTIAINETKTQVTELEGNVTANTQSIDTLSTAVTSLDGQVQGNASAIDRIETEVSEIDGTVKSISERETLLVASIRDIDDGSGALADVLNEHDSRAWIKENQTAIATNEQAIARVETELGARIDENSSYINQVFEAVADLDEAQSIVATELWSAVGDNQAAIQNTNQTIADNQSAQALINDQLSSRIDDADSGNSANANAINTLKTRVDGHDDELLSQAQSISQLEAGLTDAQSGIDANATAINEVDTRVTAVDGRVTANASDISQLQTDLSNIDGSVGANSQAISALTTRVDDHDGELQSQAQSITALETGLDDANAGISANAGAVTQLSSEVSAIDGVVQSNSQSITKLENDLADVDNNAQANSQAIQSLDNRVESIDGRVEANSTQLTALSSEIESLDGEVKGNAQAIEKIETDVSVIDGQVSSLAQRESLIVASLRGDDDGSGALTEALNEYDSRAWIRENQVAIVNAEQSISRVELELGAQISGNTALITQLAETVADNDSAQSTISNQLSSRIDDVEEDVSANAAGITQLITRVDNHDGALSSYGSSITQLQNDLSTSDGKITGNTESINLLDGKIDVVDGRVTANASEITQLKSRVDVAEGGISSNSTAISNLQTSVSAQGDTISSQGTSITALQNDLANAKGDITANAGAISTLQTTVSSQGSLISSQGSAITQLQNKVDDPNTGLAANAGALSSLNTSVSNLDGRLTAQAQSINRIESSVGSVSASVQDLNRTVTTIDGKVSATRTIKVAVNSGGTQYMAGIGVGVDNSTSGMQSQVVVVADRFSVMHTINAAPRAVFSVQGGVAYLNEAMIQNASITTAKINDVAITNAKIANLAVDEGKIASLAVTTGKIRDLSVETLKIAGNAVTIQGQRDHPGGTNVSAGGHIDSNVLTLTVPHSGALIVFVHVSGNTVANRYSPRVGLYLNGSPLNASIRSAVLDTDTQSYTYMEVRAILPAGSHTIVVRQDMHTFGGTSFLSLKAKLATFLAMR